MVELSEPRSQRAAQARGEDPGTLLPTVHRVASLAKHWLLGTRQGAIADAHLQSYLDEIDFRLNRRHSRSRGLLFYRVLELAVDHAPVRYRDLVADPRARPVPPSPPGETATRRAWTVPAVGGGPNAPFSVDGRNDSWNSRL